MGSIPLIMGVRDTRNILTVFTISAIIGLVYKIYNDLEVSTGLPKSSPHHIATHAHENLSTRSEIICENY